MLSGPVAGPTGQRVAILLPLSGARAEIGQTMLHAAQLALDGPDAPPLDAKDTGVLRMAPPPPHSRRSPRARG